MGKLITRHVSSKHFAIIFVSKDLFHVWAPKLLQISIAFAFHFVSYSIQALYTQRGRLPTSSLSLRGLTFVLRWRVVQVLVWRVLKKHKIHHFTHYTTTHTLYLHTYTVTQTFSIIFLWLKFTFHHWIQSEELPSLVKAELRTNFSLPVLALQNSVLTKRGVVRKTGTERVEWDESGHFS